MISTTDIYLQGKKVGGPKLKAGWIGMGGTSFLVTEILRETIEAAGYDLYVMSEWDYPPGSPFFHQKWTQDTWRDFMLSMDVILCPARHEHQVAKSNVKATQAMILGLPVIASPLYAYTEVIRHGENGFIADIHKLEEWGEALRALRDPETRRRIGAAGREAAKAYSLDAITDQWESLFEFILNPDFKSLSITPKDVKPGDLVDIVIATYNNLEYVKLTIASVLLNTNSSFRLIISDAGSGPEVWEYLRTLQGVTILGAPGARLNYSEACNAGIMAGTSKYVAILNSDLVVSKGWLRAMVEKMKTVDRLGACGVLSNCDRGWLHNEPMNAGPLEMVPAMKMEQVKPHLSRVYEWGAYSNEQRQGQYKSQQWVAAYCTLYARSALVEVGLFDPIYENGCEDLDHCRRLRAAGYEIGQAMDAFVFHFGGISRAAYQEEARERYNAEDARNHRIYAQKWEKKKIAIWTGPGWEKWDRSTVDAGMAGSETWASELAAEFARRGYRVLLFGDPQKAHMDRDGVCYYPHDQMENILAFDHVDAFIASRSCEPLKARIHSGQNFVMIHDVFINGNPGYDIQDGLVKKYAFLSEWHKEFLLGHHRAMRPEKMFLTMNGVRGDLYVDPFGHIDPEVSRENRFMIDTHGDRRIVKKNQTVYSSSPDRGLRALLEMLPAIRAEVPDFKVIVCYGFENWEKAAAMRQNPDELMNVAAIKAMLKQPGVEYLGRVDKETLARHQMESKVWLFPTWFHETFCITAVENGLARNAILSSNLAGLRSTVGPNGILVEGAGPYGGPHPQAYRDMFVAQAISLLTDETRRREWACYAHDGANKYTWAAAADGWIKEFGWA